MPSSLHDSADGQRRGLRRRRCAARDSGRAGVLLAALAAPAVFGACAADDAERPARTERERDSLIGQSILPGAQGVRGALSAQDSAAARNARLDSIANANR